MAELPAMLQKKTAGRRDNDNMHDLIHGAPVTDSAVRQEIVYHLRSVSKPDRAGLMTQHPPLETAP